MTKKLKTTIAVDRPFAIFFEPDGKLWVAHIVGFKLDNCTQGESPADAVSMAADLMRLLTGQCKEYESRTPHDWSTRSSDGWWTCSRCGERAAEDSLVG